MQLAINAKGGLQVGTGKPSPLHTICLSPNEDGKPLELLLSADNRHVWLTLDKATALELAKRINGHFDQ